jgi:ABC-type Fe3+/spermidine/putrescine transport system ATPase subunit
MNAVTRKFDGITAVNELSISIEPGEFVTLLGPSGCGKTTTLRLIAGFDRPDEGSVHFDGRDMTGWRPQERGFGMVFQHYALFPHLNVFENVAFGLRARKIPASKIRERVGSALDIVDLGGYGDRSVQALSGGQQQRVALARALAIEPPLLLLDEPLSNLDQALRIQTRNDLRRLVKNLGITALFVTHDQEEAFDLSDRIAVMRMGQIHQIGSPRLLYHEPANRFVASFVGHANVLPVRLESDGVRVGNQSVWPFPGNSSMKGSGGESEGAPYSLLVRPESLRFSDDPETDRHAVAGVVVERRFRGARVLYRVGLREPGVGSGPPDPEGESSQIELEGPLDGPQVGTHVHVVPKAGARLHVFPDES